MTILQALDGYYDRMARRGEAEAPGWSREKISFAIELSPQGEPLAVRDLREASGKKLVPRQLEVPAAVIRASAIRANCLWDKTAYVLGRTAGDGNRTAREHAVFRDMHLSLLAKAQDAGLRALHRFLLQWRPERFDAQPFLAEMLDSNIVFFLSGENAFIHECIAARELVAAQSGGNGPQTWCLVTGRLAPMASLHPPIKNVEGAQTAGARLVSFNLDAFTSYGQEQGGNAPVSELAAFRYGAALNRMLDRGSRNRLPRPVGDATMVFWADASGMKDAEAVAATAEQDFSHWFNPPAEADDPAADREEAAKLRQALQQVAQGRPVARLAPEVARGVRFHVLGLAPNAARLSVRFWLSDSFAAFADRLQAHHQDLTIEPRPWRHAPALNFLLAKATALQGKFDNIPPQLAGEVTRAILAGTCYPRSLLAAAVMRLRAGDDAASGWHAAAIRAVLAREHRLLHRGEAPPVSLNRDHDSAAYQLGRLFAMAEIAQRIALGTVNATIRDRYFGAASAAPASIFPLLIRNTQNHLARLRKDRKGGWIERELEQIAEHLPPCLPASLPLREQGSFVIGYYHQRRARFDGKPAEELIASEAVEQGEGHDD